MQLCTLLFKQCFFPGFSNSILSQSLSDGLFGYGGSSPRTENMSLHITSISDEGELEGEKRRSVVVGILLGG